MILRLLLKLLCVGLIIFLLDLTIGYGLRRLYFHRPFGNRKSLIYVIENMKDPIVIMGSSRAQHHYVPSLFRLTFGKSCFNAGLDGAFIEYHEALLELVLKRYVPELLILDISASEFDESDSRLQAISKLLPFYAQSDELHSLVQRTGPMERIKLMSRIYPFNSEIIQLLLPYFVGPDILPDYPDGYIPLFKAGSLPPTPIEEPGQVELDAFATSSFRGFISRAKENGVSLFVVVSPSLRRYQRATRSIDYARSLCEAAAVPFWDMSETVSILQHPEYFYDRTHLNDRGAREFTRLVIDRLK